MSIVAAICCSKSWMSSSPGAPQRAGRARGGHAAGRPDDAKKYLGSAIEKDAAKVRQWLAADPMFDALKGDAEFEKMANA